MMAVRVLALFVLISMMQGSLPSVTMAQTEVSGGGAQPATPVFRLDEELKEDEEEKGGSRRLRIVAKRRMGPAVMVHRGARALAPENTLAAFEAAMELGGDGVELDIRRSRDQVLVVFHDQTVERLLEGFGRVSDYTVHELRALEPVRWKERAVGGTVPTLGEVLQLARDRAMLLHLDLKEPELQQDVANVLEAEDLWDHVVSINRANADELRQDPRYRPLRYKAPGLYPRRLDLDPDALRAALEKPGEMILVDDPRVAVWILGRSLPAKIRSGLPRRSASQIALSRGRSKDSDNDRHWWELLEASYPNPNPQELIWELNNLEDDLDVGLTLSEGELRRIATTRAWIAWKLGHMGQPAVAVQQSLAAIVMQPTPITGGLYGLDAAMAARSLGRLNAVESVPVLTQVLLVAVSVDLEMRTPQQLWRHWRPRMTIMAALGELHVQASRTFLQQYVRYSPEEAARFGLPAFEEATLALLSQKLDQEEIEALLRSGNPAVRGTTLLECLDYPAPARSRALASVMSWATTLPSRPPTDP
jgi:hypothetical protein